MPKMTIRFHGVLLSSEVFLAIDESKVFIEFANNSVVKHAGLAEAFPDFETSLLDDLSKRFGMEFQMKIVHAEDAKITLTEDDLTEHLPINIVIGLVHSSPYSRMVH